MLLLLLLLSLQLCPTLCDPIDGSPPGSLVPGILQARTLEWVAISFSNIWKWKVKVNSLSRVQLLATPWTAAHQAPPSVGFSRQECWSGVPLWNGIDLYNFFWKIDWNSWNFVNIPFKGVNPNKTIVDSSKWISTVPDYKTSDQKMALFTLFFKKSNQNNETEREGDDLW